MTFQKNISELEARAVLWWPDDLKKEVAGVSVVPLLAQSQDDFITILQSCDGDDPTQIFDVLQTSNLPANLFLKHLIVLADYGGEPIQRLNANFETVFECSPRTRPYMRSVLKGREFTYIFEALPHKGVLNNKMLRIDGAGISQSCQMTPLMKDMVMILLYGANALNTQGADLEKCEIGNFLSDKSLLDRYIRQKYMFVSRITGGATANSHGQVAQDVVRDHLSTALGNSYKITRNGSVKLKSYPKGAGMPFDIVVEKNGLQVGIEVSFQVTTNSVIERKAGQAQERQKMMHEMGYKIAYVIDGAGNFQRKSAISTLCQYSDCTVAYSASEFDVLAEFIRTCM